MYYYSTIALSDYESAVLESQHTTRHHKPTQVRHKHWVYMSIESEQDPDILGKWLVFKHFDEIDETWEKIQTAMVEDRLQGCLHAKCSTMRYNPSCSGPGPDTTAVICVYTEEHNLDDIGFKLVEIVRQDIKYKTDADTLDYKYTHAGSGKTTIKTIYWNFGRPSFECEGRTCRGTSYRREDLWRLNFVEAPEPFSSWHVDGRWVLRLEYEELTSLWHFLKDIFESKSKNFGVIRMVCPPKRDRNSPDEKPVFHIYTSASRKSLVGRKLIKIIERDMLYEQKPRYYHLPCLEETLFWNDGEPAYEHITRKGITKNWRTGEEVS